jgi:protein gp37
MAETSIEWTQGANGEPGYTFNIVWGCEKVSPACKNCYAETWAKRYGFDVWGADKPRRTFGAAHWKEPIRWNTAAEKAQSMRSVFCSSMADVFEDHPTLAAERIKLWDLIKATPWLKWLLLTKRPENVRRMVPSTWLDEWPANVFPGFTAENQEWYDRRHDHALLTRTETPWFVSYEPALGPIDFRGLFGIAWLIVGGESGAGARPMMLSWVRSARDQANAAGVPFFLKQKIESGKKISLPVLDGRQWAEMPSLPIIGGT